MINRSESTFNVECRDYWQEVFCQQRQTCLDVEFFCIETTVQGLQCRRTAQTIGEEVIRLVIAILFSVFVTNRHLPITTRQLSQISRHVGCDDPLCQLRVLVALQRDVVDYRWISDVTKDVQRNTLGVATCTDDVTVAVDSQIECFTEVLFNQLGVIGLAAAFTTVPRDVPTHITASEFELTFQAQY